MLNVVLLKMSNEYVDKHVMCSTCSEKLNAAFDFKSTCLYTNNVILTYVDFENLVPVDLREIYMKENGSGELVDAEICRLCMQPVKKQFTSVHEVDVDIFQRFVPEVASKFNATKNPVICKLCIDAVTAHSCFVRNCLGEKKNVKCSFPDETTDGPVNSNLHLRIKREIKDEIIKSETYPDCMEDMCDRDSIKTEEIQIKCEYIEDERSKNNKKVVHSQGRRIVYNVYEFMRKEKESKKPIKLEQVQARVAEATGVSLSTVKRVICEHGASPSGCLSTPRKKIKKPSPRSTLDKFEEEIIRTEIYRFAAVYKRHVTMKALFEAVKNDLNLTGKISSFRKIIHKLGFRWRKSQDNKKALCETTDIRLKRTEFLRKLRQYKQEGKNIVYSGRTYIHSSHTAAKACDYGTINCLKSPVAKGKRVIVVHAGSKKGFVPNAGLIFKSDLKTGENDMNQENYSKWLEEKLIPNLDPNSVLVVDHESYNNAPVEPIPTFNWLKPDMQNWLRERGVVFDDKETKPELYAKIKLNKPQNTETVTDRLLATHGHVVLRLPPYHPELNPIDKIWGIVKNIVAACNRTFKVDDVWKLVQEKLANVTNDVWNDVCEHVEKVEEEYISREHFIDEINELIIRVDGNDSDESDFFNTSDDNDDDWGC